MTTKQQVFISLKTLAKTYGLNYKVLKHNFVKSLDTLNPSEDKTEETSDIISSLISNKETSLALNKKILFALRDISKTYKLSYKELKRVFMKDLDVDKKTKKVKELGFRTRRTRTTNRKKKEVDMDKNRKENIEEYAEVLQFATINGTECYVPTKNGKLIERHTVYSTDSKRIGVVCDNRILFFNHKSN